MVDNVALLLDGPLKLKFCCWSSSFHDLSRSFLDAPPSFSIGATAIPSLWIGINTRWCSVSRKERISRRSRRGWRGKWRRRRRRANADSVDCLGDHFRIPPRCLLGVRVRGVRICQFVAASAAGSVSSGSVRASVTRDLQHGGAQEKQEAQRCKRRIWTGIAASPVRNVGTRYTANVRRDRSTWGATRVAAYDRSRSIDPRNVSAPISGRSEWRRQIPRHELAVPGTTSSQFPRPVNRI